MVLLCQRSPLPRRLSRAATMASSPRGPVVPVTETGRSLRPCSGCPSGSRGGLAVPRRHLRGWGSHVIHAALPGGRDPGRVLSHSLPRPRLCAPLAAQCLEDCGDSPPAHHEVSLGPLLLS